MPECGASNGILRHLRRTSGLIASSVTSLTLYHVAITYWISVNEMLLSNCIASDCWNPVRGTIIIPCRYGSMTATPAGYGPQSDISMSPCSLLHRVKNIWFLIVRTFWQFKMSSYVLVTTEKLRHWMHMASIANMQGNKWRQGHIKMKNAIRG